MSVTLHTNVGDLKIELFCEQASGMDSTSGESIRRDQGAVRRERQGGARGPARRLKDEDSGCCEHGWWHATWMAQSVMCYSSLCDECGWHSLPQDGVRTRRFTVPPISRVQPPWPSPPPNQAPRASENFLALCASGYYDNVHFHRNIKVSCCFRNHWDGAWESHAHIKAGQAGSQAGTLRCAPRGPTRGVL